MLDDCNTCMAGYYDYMYYISVYYEAAMTIVSFLKKCDPM